MGRGIHRVSIPLLLFLLGVLFTTSFTSCRTSRTVATREIRPMSADRVIRRVEKESPRYDYYSADRVSLLIDSGGEKNSVSAQIKMKKDDRMIVTLRKIGFPIGRGLLTRDSVVVVNFIDKSFVSDDYKALKKMFGIELEYNLVQAILTADISKFTDHDLMDREFTSSVDGRLYRLESEYNRKIARAMSRGQDRRLSRYMDSMDDQEFYSIVAWVCPEKFVVRKIEMNNIKTKQKIVVTYDGFEQTGRQLFPTIIELDYAEKTRAMKLQLKIGKISLQKERDFTFAIPERYEQFN